MSNTNFIIVGIVRGSDLHGTGPELHVDGNGISDDRQTSIKEGMNREFAMEVL